jgi:CheY-like chemotaxis protein
MSDRPKSVVIVVLQYSVVVKGIERKLMDAGYQTMIIKDGFDKLKDLSVTTDLFLLYLPAEISEKSDLRERLNYICDKIKNSEGIMIGEAKDHSPLALKVPAVSDFVWLDRPIEMDDLPSYIDKTISGELSPDRKKRILIVDDDPSYAKMIREWIKDHYQTDIVTAGMQAITFLLKHDVDLILLDYEMPVVDGPQVLQMLRQEPATAKIPVIFLTGVGTKEAVERVMQLKPSGYILKTASRDDLLKYLHGKLG